MAEGEVLADLGATDKATNGAGDVCAVAALYLATRYASQPDHALRAAARQPGADTDTLASMVGSLVGALVGTDAIAPFLGVQDAETVGALSRDLAQAEARDESVPDELDPRPAVAVDRFTGQLSDGSDNVCLPDGREAVVVQHRRLSKQSTPNEVMGYYVRCADGQGLLVVTRRQRSRDELDRPGDRLPPDEDSKPRHTPAAQQSAGAAEGRPELAPPADVQLLLRHGEPDRLVELLQCVGLSAKAEGHTWQVHGVPLTVVPDSATPRLDFEPRAVTAEITVRTAQIDQVCRRLRDAGWTVDKQVDEALVVEGRVAVRLVPKSPERLVEDSPGGSGSA